MFEMEFLIGTSTAYEHKHVPQIDRKPNPKHIFVGNSILCSHCMVMCQAEQFVEAKIQAK